MPKLAIVAALEREVRGLTKNSRSVEREHQGRNFIFFERKNADKNEDENTVIVCGGIGLDSARRAAEAVIALYHPTELQSVGFAGALDQSMHVGDLFIPSAVIDARDGSRVLVTGIGASIDKDSQNALVTFMSVAGAQQKRSLAQAFAAKAVDMEAAAVAAAAAAHGLGFAATKVISDELDFEMPQMERFIDARGQFRTAAFAAFLALRPWLWLRVAALARNSRKAARALGSYFAQLNREQNQPVETNTH
jgi:adenosylhomocysteine nucleosidase